MPEPGPRVAHDRLDLCRNAGAWEKPEVKCKEDMGDFGGTLEDDVGVQGSNYTCGMGRNEKKFFNATDEEHKALVETCKSFPTFGENYCPLKHSHARPRARSTTSSI